MNILAPAPGDSPTVGFSKQFAAHYYQKCEKGEREKLVIDDGLYVDQSIVAFEGKEFVGKQAIQTKFAALPKVCKFALTTIDAQPRPEGNGTIILVLGQLKADDDMPLGFCHTFNVVQIPANAPGQQDKFVISNEMFRIL